MVPTAMIRVLLFVLVSSTLMKEAWLERVIGGKPAAPGQFPFMALLLYNNRVTCSASIVSDKWALTAAHCISEYLPTTNYRVLAGTVNPATDTQHAQLRNVSRVLIHPSYTVVGGIFQQFFTFDICLIQVTKPFEWNTYVKPITITNTTTEYEPGECVVMGFGHRSLIPCSTKELYYLTSRSRVHPCTEKELSWRKEEHQLCSSAGILGIEHLYKGDSGGPLVCNGKQIGISSMIRPATIFWVLQVHTSVPHFYDWVRQYAFCSEDLLL